MMDISADIALGSKRRARRQLSKAVHQNRAISVAGLSERLFTALFSGLVYPQIWEDPDVDMDAMQLGEGHRVVTIASGGCNVLAYLTRSPASIDAVDLNTAHIALNRLKLAAIRHLPSQADLFRFFGSLGNRHNAIAYDRFIAPHVDAATQRYWEGRTWTGRRRINAFNGNFYEHGLLGFFIRAGHFVARRYGVDPTGILRTRSMAEQRRFFNNEIRPLFRKRLVRLATSRKLSLFCLGIPPAQYDALNGDGSAMADVLEQRLEKLACHFPVHTNYFAWQAFARQYAMPGEAALPAYLENRNYPVLRANIDRVKIHHVNFVELLAKKPAGSVDRFVLLDAQDWMTDEQLGALWTEITRTAAPGARVIFRTAGEETILPGRIPDHLLAEWKYRDADSRDYSVRDRSAIYGAFHLYEKAAA